MTMFDEFKRLAEEAKVAQDKAYETSQRFWDADKGKIPCSDEEYAQFELDYDEAEAESRRAYQDCLEYIDRIADELDFSAYKLNIPYKAREKVTEALGDALVKWLDEYGLDG